MVESARFLLGSLTMNHNLHRAGIVIAALLMTQSAGCVVSSEGEEELGGTDYSVIASNGIGLNGIGLNGVGLNGIGLNGIGLNGVGLNGVGLNGVSLNGVGLNGVGLNGSSLTSKTSWGQTLWGNALIGAEFTGPLLDGSEGNFRIDDIDVINGDVRLYTISFEMDGARHNLCGDSDGAPVRAIPLKGLWNYEQDVPGGGKWINDSKMITFACEGFALAKCVEAGYKPWAFKWGKSLRPHHQTCTRMLRADYCGNGRSWTVDGTLVNYYDKKGIQSDAASWPFEAEWDEDGAVCLSHQRVEQLGFHPSCDFEKSSSKCGSKIKWDKPTLIASEAQ